MPAEPVHRDPHALLEHAAWLRRLALSLVGDRAAADDLVQETWIAALRRPPDDARPLRPWLRRVLENAARFRWRGDTNRATREERAAVAAVASGADATPTSEELLERHQTQQLLARLVSELEEPYRSTILLRYAEGLEPSEIARRQGVPAGTVRWRVKTGLDRLRAKLDEAHGGDRRVWMLALGPLASPRGASAPATGATSTSGGDSSGGSSGGGSSGGGPSWLVLGVAALAVAIIVGAIVMTRSSSRAASRERAGDATDAVAGAHARSSRAAEASAYQRLAAIAAGQPPGWIAQEGVAPRRIAGRVVDDGQPAAGVMVRLTSELTLAGLVPPLEQRTDAKGRFDFGEQVARQYAVGATAPDRLGAIARIDLRHPSPRPPSDALELALLPCTAAFHGVVKDAGGAPVAHASILREDVVGTEAGADGRYELCVWPSAAHVDQLHLVVRADGYGTVMLEAAPSGRVRRDIVLTPEAVITGRVVDEHGAAVALAKVWTEPDVEGHRPPSEQAATLFTVTGDDGRFRITGVLGGRHRIAAAARGRTAQRRSVSVAAGASVEIALAMVATGRVRGRVLLDGAPVAGAQVRVQGELSDSAVSQLDGSFVLDRVGAGEMRLSARPYSVQGTDTVTVASGADAAIELHVARMGSLRGTVRRHGVPVPYARVDLGGTMQIGTHADGQGRYLFEGLRPGEYAWLADDARRGAFVAGQWMAVVAGETHVLDLELVSGARVTGTVVDGAGRAVAGSVVRLVAAGGDEGRCATDAAGAFDCAQMTGGGAYAASVYVGDDATVPYPFVGPSPPAITLLDGDARVDGVRLVVDPRLLAIAGTVTDAAGEPIADARVQARGAPSENYRWSTLPSTVTDVDGAFTITSLAPGTYQLEVAGIDGSRSARREASAGATDVVLVVERPVCSDRTPTARVRQEPAGITTRPPARVVWGEPAESLELLGWDLPETVRRGEPFTITTYYRTLAPLDRAWTIFVHIDGTKARHLGDHEPLGGTCPSSTWQPGDILVDRFTTTMKPEHMHAGRYAVWIGFFTGWAPNWRNFEVHTAPAAMTDSAYKRIKIADLNVE